MSRFSWIRKSLLALAIAGSAAAGQTASAANLLADGDFESFANQVANGGYKVVSAGSLGAWTVGGNSVDLVRNSFGSISNVSIDLLGTPGPGSISQSFMVQQGYTYTLTFDHFQNSSTANMNLSFGGQDYSFAAPAAPKSESLSFMASTSGMQTLTFSAAGAVPNGPTLDNVMLTVTAVPEPSSYALILAGLGVIGFVARRRKPA